MNCLFKFTPKSRLVYLQKQRSDDFKRIIDLAYVPVNKPEEIPTSAVRYGQYIVRSKEIRTIYHNVPIFGWFVELRSWNKNDLPYLEKDWYLWPVTVMHKTWMDLDKVYNYLSPYWKRMTYAYMLWYEGKITRRRNYAERKRMGLK